MRVLAIGSMYPPQYLGGYELMWLSSNRDLLAAGHDVRVLTTDVRVAAEAPEEHGDVHRTLRWYWKDHAWPRLSFRERVALERHNARTLRRHLREFRPDVVAVWAMGGMSLGLLEQIRRARIPAVGMVADDWMVYGPEVDAWTRMHDRHRWLRPLTSTLLRLPSEFRPGAVGHWLFISRTTEERARSTGRPLPQAAIANAGIESHLLPPADPGEWRNRLLCLGRIDERKGLETAVAMLAELPGYTLSVVGSGDEAFLDRLERQAEAACVADRVSFGRAGRDQVGKVIAAHDVLVFPVRWIEPWGLVPLEAMAVGIPVISTEAGGPSEYIEAEENGILLPRDAAAPEFAEQVRRLAADPQLRRRLVEGGRRTAARHTAERYNRQVREALEEAAR